MNQVRLGVALASGNVGICAAISKVDQLPSMMRTASQLKRENVTNNRK